MPDDPSYAKAASALVVHHATTHVVNRATDAAVRAAISTVTHPTQLIIEGVTCVVVQACSFMLLSLLGLAFSGACYLVKSTASGAYYIAGQTASGTYRLFAIEKYPEKIKSDTWDMIGDLPSPTKCRSCSWS